MCAKLRTLAPFAILQKICYTDTGTAAHCPEYRLKSKGERSFFCRSGPTPRFWNSLFVVNIIRAWPVQRIWLQSNSFPSRIELRKTGNPGGNLSAVTKFFPDGTVNSQTNQHQARNADRQGDSLQQSHPFFQQADTGKRKRYDAGTDHHRITDSAQSGICHDVHAGK